MRLVKGVEEFGWNHKTILDIFRSSGEQGQSPPDFSSIGTVCHFYGDAGAMSVQLEPTATLRIGDKVAVRLRDRFHEQLVESMQINTEPVPEATGVRVGIQTSLRRSDVPTAAE